MNKTGDKEKSGNNKIKKKEQTKTNTQHFLLFSLLLPLCSVPD
jgi:hypothetical protein